MKLAIFGATGRTGMLLVQQALDAGHSVVALVRTPSKMTIQHEHLRLVEGDVMVMSDVVQTVRGCDAVLVAVGQGKEFQSSLQLVTARNIVAAMLQFGVRRLVTLVSAVVPAPEDQPGIFDRFIKSIFNPQMSKTGQDATEHVRVIRESNLDWVIVRASKLLDGPYTGQYRVGWVGVGTGRNVVRADVADFMLKQLTDRIYIQQAPVVSN